jgi:multidrug efflux pump subunit AcrB
MSSKINMNGPIAWMASNPIAANLLLLLVFLLGFMGLKEIPKEVLPSFPIEAITVTVPYPGSSAEEVERGIVIKLEEAVRDIVGIKELRSQSREGVGTVTVQMLPNSDMSRALSDVKMRVDSIAAFPLDAEKPIVAESIYKGGAVWLSISADMDYISLKELTEQMREEVLMLDGITEISMIGDRTYEISIEISQQDIQRYGLTFAQITNVIRKQSRDLPGGQMRTDAGTIKLRSESQAYSGEDYGRLPLLTRADGTFVYLRDVAKIDDSFNEMPVLSVMNGKPSMTLMIQTVGDQNVLDIVEKINKYSEEKRQQLAENIEITSWVNQSTLLEGRIELMMRNALQGAALVIIVLALFLDLTLAFWVVLGVPFAMLGTIATIYIFDLPVTINVLSVFAFILVLGILVDDGIVTAESAYSQLQKERNGLTSVVGGVRRVAISTIFGALTTMIAFMPALFIVEGFGRMLSQLGIVVILCIIFSLIETKLILPAHLRHVKLVKKERGYLAWFYRLQNLCANALNSFAKGPYLRFLERAVNHRYTSLSVFFAIFFVTAALIPSGWVRFTFFPVIPSDFISANLEMPEGTSWRVTHEMARHIEASVYRMDERHKKADPDNRSGIKHVYLVSSSDTNAQLVLELTPSEERVIDGVTMSNWLREEVGPISGARSFVIHDRAGPAGMAALEIEVTGNNIDKLRQVSQKIKMDLQGINGVYDIRDSFKSGGTEYDIRLTPEGQALGLGAVDLAAQVRNAFYGSEVQRVQRGKHEVRVFVRLAKADRSMLGAINDLWIQLPNGTSVPFPVVGKIEEYSGLSVINRIDRNRVVTVSADFNKASVELGEIISFLNTNTFQNLNQQFPEVRINLGGEAEQQSNTSDTLGLAALIVLVLIYSALAIPLKSYGQPLLIMSVIPFGITGAITGHWLMGMDLSILSIIGILGLTGVVVNDSLVMVDFINHFKAAGHGWREAIMQAGVRRFRAVFLTSITTFVGLIPIQLERSLQAQFVKPMATSLAFGILFSTVVTLILVPVLYFIAKDIKHWLFPHLNDTNEQLETP